MALDQFSTPPEVAALAVLAARIRPGDTVLEPSAGTGMLAVVAEACGGVLSLNERSQGPAVILDGLFGSFPRTRHDGRHIHDLAADAGAFDVVVVNPPFSDLSDHLAAAVKALADHGRLAAVAPLPALTDARLLRRLTEIGTIVGRIGLPAGAFARQGTSVETGLLVIDRVARTGEAPPVIVADDLEGAAEIVAALTERVGARPRARVEAASASLLDHRARSLTSPSRRLAFLNGAAPLVYEVKAWSGEGRDVGLYQAHALARVSLPDPRPHPSPLVESGPMASVSPRRRPIAPCCRRPSGAREGSPTPRPKR